MSKLNAAQRQVLLPLGASLALSFSGALMAEETQKVQTLSTVRVEGKQDVSPAHMQNNGYQGLTSRAGKTEQALKDIPQAITVITKELLQDRNDFTLKEALGNVAGLTFNAGEGGRIGDNINLRGFYSFGDLYQDGIRDVAQYNRETFNNEQVDILRGSAAMLFGRGQAGGVINQVSKQPVVLENESANFGEAAVTLGSHDFKRATVDINRELSDTAAFRVNAMKTDAGSTRDNVRSEREGLAPTIAWGIGTANQFSIGHFYLKTRNTPDYGVPMNSKTHRPMDVSGNTFYGTTRDYEANTTNMTTATYTHKFSDVSQVRSVLRAAQYDRDLWVTHGTGLTDNSPTSTTGSIGVEDLVTRRTLARGGHEKTLTSQTDFTTKFETGGLKHEALVGVELLKEQAERWNYANPYTGSTTNPLTTNALYPDSVLPAGYDQFGNQVAGLNIGSGASAVFTPGLKASYKGFSTAFYAQDTVEFRKGWKVLAGLRYDKMNADYSNPAAASGTPTNYSVNYGEWSYRTGLMYQPKINHSYYLAFSDSFNPTADLYQFSSSTTPAERSKTLELGAKWDLMDGDLSLRTALYRTQKDWERNTDIETASTNSVLSRRRHTDGVELEVAGRITPQWDVFGGVALMRAEIDEQAPGHSAAIAGMRPRNAPPYTFNVWSTYKLGGWKLGGGVRGMGNRMVYGLNSSTNPANVNVAPYYQRWDAMLAYEQRTYTIKFNVLNVLDRRYYESVYENGGFAVPGTQRTAQVTAVFKF